jgi:asparagine synthase (glutamine-hydrolysing)
VCGINGIFDDTARRAGAVPAAHEIEAMNQALVHRGPDGGGTHLGPGIALGHRRLSIIDLSDAGAQPMYNEDGTLALVFNGEIYNYLELIPELVAAGHVFRSRSDSEVILHAYEEWGEDCVQRFNGMWAFALWDARRQRLFLSRDRLGVKPLCYLEHGRRLLFSSEPAGIRAVVPVDRADLGKLHAYLAYGYRTSDGRTLFEGIRELPPGHNAVADADGLRIRRYWSLPETRHDIGADEAAQALRGLLTDAVRLRFRSDVPVALLQSGGLDSSVICTIVNDEIEAGRLAMTRVAGYTAVHPGHPYDESQAVRALMASCPRVDSIELQPSGQALAERLPEFIRQMQEPMASATSYAHWCLMQAIHAEGIKVVINGQGSDEALAGYGRYIVGYRLLDLLAREPGRAWAEAGAMRERMGYGWAFLAAQLAKALLGRRAASHWRARYAEGGGRVLDPAWTRDNPAALPEVPGSLAGGNLDRHLRTQLLGYGFNQILHYEDQSSMSQSVEIRSPFIDYRLMEFAFSLPLERLFSDGVTKRVLREAYSRRLPASIADNHRKLGFATPFEDWSAAPGFRAFLADLVGSESFRSRRLWDPKRLARQLLDPDSARRGFPVWRFVNAELWMRQNGITHA